VKIQRDDNKSLSPRPTTPKRVNSIRVLKRSVWRYCSGMRRGGFNIRFRFCFRFRTVSVGTNSRIKSQKILPLKAVFHHFPQEVIQAPRPGSRSEQAASRWNKVQDRTLRKVPQKLETGTRRPK